MRRLVKKGLLPTNKASGRSRANVAKAASIAPLVSALRIRISHPRARAAGSTSRNIVSVFVVSAGLTITAIRATPGISSRRSSSRLATSSVETKLMPVRLPPGRARLATRPSLTGSSATAKTMGIVVVAALAAKAETGPSAEAITVTCRRTNSPGAVRPAVFDCDVLALDMARLLQPLSKRAQTLHVVLKRCGAEEPDHRQRLLLC